MPLFLFDRWVGKFNTLETGHFTGSCYTCGHTLKCSLGVKGPSHRNPMYFPEVSVDGVFESVHSVRLHNMLRESIPSVNNTLTEIVLSDV